MTFRRHGLRRLFLLTAAGLLGTHARAVPAVSDLVVYEVNLRSFSQAGDLAGVSARLDEIQALGANTVWLMPIHPVGQVNSVGGLGSPYSVRDHGVVSNEYGSLADLTNLIDQAHQRDLSVIMDWVPNHTAWDHAWITEHPEWYSQDGQGNIIHPPGTNWTDVADLNYNNPSLRATMINEMKYWVTDVGIDGFRVDTADFVPYSFWQQAVPAVRNSVSRDLIMLAEGGRTDHYNAGFDLTYGWDFYNAVDAVFNGSASASSLIAAHHAEYAGVPQDAEILRFTTNHDFSAFDETPPDAFGNVEASLAAYAVTVAYGGAPLVYAGQEIGWDENIPIFNKSPLDWNTGAATEAWYTDLLNARSASSALIHGNLNDQSTADVVLLHRQHGDEQAVVLVNTRGQSRQVSVPAGWRGDWTDLLSEQATSLGATRLLAPYEVVVLGATFTPSLVVAGSLQTEQGDPADWDPAGSSLVMTGTDGVYTVTANNLSANVAYDFRVYDTADQPPSDLGSNNANLTLYGDADGAATITVDTRITNNKGNPVVWIDFDTAPLQVVGDFMIAAGGANNWDPADDAFNMTAHGDGFYTFEAVIDSVGTYQFKATFGQDWWDQVGTDGFNDNARTQTFTTTQQNEHVRLIVDLANRLLGASSVLPGDYSGNGQVEQGDLDLVLQNWGLDTAVNGIPAGWVNDLPTGVIEQSELDRVLQHWGAASAPTGLHSPIPEPASVSVLVLFTIGASRPSRALLNRRRDVAMRA